MKKQTMGSLLVAGALLVGCASAQTEVADTNDAVEEEVNVVVEQVNEKVSYTDLLKEGEWNIATNTEYGWDTTVTGVITNTTDSEIEYIEVEYKVIKDNVTADSSWTNAINIETGESAKLEFYTFEEFDTIKVKDSESDEWVTLTGEQSTDAQQD